jgi:hypothetical protein
MVQKIHIKITNKLYIARARSQKVHRRAGTSRRPKATNFSVCFGFFSCALQNNLCAFGAVLCVEHFFCVCSPRQMRLMVKFFRCCSLMEFHRRAREFIDLRELFFALEQTGGF